MEMLCPVSEETFLKHHPIYISSISEGFDHFLYCCLVGSEKSYIDFLSDVIIMNGNGSCFFDFYFEKMEPEKQKGLAGLLNPCEQEILRSIHLEKDQIFYPLTREVMPVIAKISVNQWLFSTFYFTKYPMTLWSNYDCRFPLFAGSSQIFEKYIQIAKNHGIGLTP